MEGIWEVGLWLGGFFVFTAIIFLVLKLIQLVDKIMNRADEERDGKYWLFLLMKYFPFFIIVLPILQLIMDVMVDAEGIDDMTISSMAYQQLLVEQAPQIGAFIIAWTILYILVIMGYEESEVSK